MHCHVQWPFHWQDRTDLVMRSIGFLQVSIAISNTGRPHIMEGGTQENQLWILYLSTTAGLLYWPSTQDLYMENKWWWNHLTWNCQPWRVYCLFPDQQPSITLRNHICSISYGPRGVFPSLLCKSWTIIHFIHLPSLMDAGLQAHAPFILVLGADLIIQQPKSLVEPLLQWRWCLDLGRDMHGHPYNNTQQILHEGNITPFKFCRCYDSVHKYRVHVQMHNSREIVLLEVTVARSWGQFWHNRYYMQLCKDRWDPTLSSWKIAIIWE